MPNRYIEVRYSGSTATVALVTSKSREVLDQIIVGNTEQQINKAADELWEKGLSIRNTHGRSQENKGDDYSPPPLTLAAPKE